MAANGQYLRPILDAGSSRVFNINDVARTLERKKSEQPYIFRTPAMHRMVLIKDVLGRDDPSHPRGYVLGTKLYLPYDAADVYDGGRSIFLHSKNLKRVFHEQFGVEMESESLNDFDDDLRLLQTVDRLPSLDGFLMRDALELEGFALNESYFEVSPAERAAIQEFIRSKMVQLVRAAYGGQTPPIGKVNSLTDKVWEAKDLAALDPLIQAFRFPRDRALSIFSGWKGIIFYEFEYQRTRRRREELALWLKNDASPKYLTSRDEADLIEMARRMTVERLRAHWVGTDALLQKFDGLYSDFVDSGNPNGFIAFLADAGEAYWRLGDSLSKINHAINCWDITTKPYAGRRAPYDRLERLLSTLSGLLAPLAVSRTAEAA